MKCSRCGINEATILVKQIVNGKETQLHLCEDCAKAMGISSGNFDFFGFSQPQNLAGNIFNALGMLNNSAHVNTGVFVPSKQDTLKCPNCGTTLAEFRETGKLGCSKCYDVFPTQLNQIFRRIQSGEVHHGRKNAQELENREIKSMRSEIDVLKVKIQKAVEKEDYESAAEYKTEMERLKEKIAKINVSEGGEER